MCTLLTADRDTYRNHGEALRGVMQTDSLRNDDGVALLLLHADGQVTSLRAMDLDHAVECLESLPWVRFWLHQRAATTTSVDTEFTHGYCTGGVWYMHNGVIRGPEVARLPVDSMVIGRWINQGTVYKRLAKEPFSNVFLVAPKQNVYTVWRSPGGTLHTDGQGNYSTHAVGPITQPVATGQTNYWLRDPDVLAEERKAEAEARAAVLLSWAKRRKLDYDPSLDGVGSLWPYT
jgi:hypothetical protein